MYGNEPANFWGSFFYIIISIPDVTRDKPKVGENEGILLNYFL